ncbi:SDR family oxidoreductase [Acidithiobacillus sp. M4-SHS-6]|uniref:SDR family oxidoreductase n=1 Tax=Acidithiobacillus sp. M4-SHS-6 TaxID=3383024 RepID=UPI0039BDB244
MLFNGKRILVTGATQGIGRATAQRLRVEGGHTIALGRNAAALKILQSEIGCDIICFDLVNIEAIDKKLKEFFPIDYLVNCAGIVEPSPFLATSAENFERTMRVNALAPMRLAQILACHWIETSNPGAIVNVSSLASSVGTPKHAAYCASKAALDALTRVMAIELGGHKIRVNSVNPVVTKTPMAELAWSDPTAAAAMKARIPLGRFAESQEVAAAIVFLLSESAAMIHGVCLNVDGGFSAG